MEQAESPPVSTPATRSRIARWIGAAMLGLAALVGALLLSLNTGPGRSFVAGRLSGLTFANGLRIGVGRVDGSLFGKARLVDVIAYDTKGAFLRVPAIELDWRPLAYLGGHLDVRTLTASQAVLERVPVFKPSTSKGPLLPDLDIDVGRLRVDRLTALPAVAGQVRTLRLEGQAKIADRRAQLKARIDSLAVVGGTVGGDRLELVLDAVPEADRLALHLALDAPQGGVIGALAKQNVALSLRLDGAGDWARWNGTLAADLAARPLARLSLSARNGTFAVKGPAELGRPLGGVPAVLLDATTMVDLSAVLDRRRARLSGSLRSNQLVLIPQGVIDLSNNSFDGLRLDLALLKPAALAPNLSGRALRAQVVLDGAFARPQAQYRLSAAALGIKDIALEGVEASGKARVEADHLLVPLTGRIGRITGLDAAAGGTLANVRLDGDLAFDGSRILSDNMKIRSDRIDAKAILLADMARGFYTGALEGRVNDYRIASIGSFAVETRADLKRAGAGFALSGMLRARSTRLTDPSVRDFLGGNAVGSGAVTYGPDGVVRFASLRLAAPQLQVFDGHGSFVPGGPIAIAATGHSARYGPLALELGGTLAQPRAVVLARSPGFGIGLADLRAEILGSDGGYRFNAKGQTDYGPLSAEVTLLAGRETTLRIDHGDLAGIAFSGTLQSSPAGPFSGEIRADGRGAGGVIRLGVAGHYQQMLINLRANNMALPGPAKLTVGSAIVDADVVLSPHPRVIADVQLAQTRLRNVDLAASRAQIDYQDGRGQAQFLIEGISNVPFRVAGNAQLSPDLWRVSLDGRVRGIALHTASPARIVPSPSGYELLPSRFDLGQGSLRLSGKFGAGLKIESRMDRLDLALLNAFAQGAGVGGHATGSLDFEQASPDAFPRADARLAIADFSRSTANVVSQPVDINLIGNLLPDGGEARAVIRRRGAVIGRMVASLRPLGPGAGSWVSRVAAAPLGGGIRYNGPAETLWSLIGQANQSLVGPIAVGADFAGRLRQPQLSGVVRGEGLTYTNEAYGTRLTALNLAGHFAGNRLQVEQLAAKAGSGTVSGQGFLTLAADEGYPMDLGFTLANAQLARSDALAASATGELRLTKHAGETALLSGKLHLPETHYQLVRQGAAEVPELAGVRFKPQTGRVRITGNEPAPPAGSLFQGLRLDVALSAPNQLFVTGMGIDSEWSADLRVTGTSAAPQMAGNIDLVRGNLGFAGRQFDLQEGRLLFTGGVLSDPQLALTASDDIDDVTVGITVSGRALNPQFAFTSNPSLPGDEVLSRILFGNSVGQLSPLQALQLAASLNSLRASGNGLSPLGKLRAATGVSRLRILPPDAVTGRQTALAAGRYISNRIYLELITDARGFTAMQMEVGLSRTLSLLSQAGGSGVSNLNLRYRKRY